MTAKITFLDDYQGVAISSADWSSLQDRYLLDSLTEHIADPNRLVARLADSEVIVAMRERTALPAAIIDRLPNLKLIVTTGMNNSAIDLAATTARGIPVCGTRGRPSGVSELVIGMIIAVMRSIAIEDAHLREGGWQHTIGPGLEGSTLGLVGLGNLGKRVAELALVFGMNVIAWTPNLTPERAAEHGVVAVTKEELFRTSDVVSLHAPLSDSTRGMVGAAEFDLMKTTSYLVNTSRGPLVVEPDLVEALRSSRIAGAALDVYDVEPLPADHVLRTLRNVLLVPHLGYVTTNAYRVFYADAVEDIRGFLDGSLVRPVVPKI